MSLPEEVKIVDISFVDIYGIPKVQTIPASEYKKAVENGITFDGSSIEAFVRISESDMRIKPNPNTLKKLYWNKKKAVVFGDVYRNDEPFEGDPRFILKRAENKARLMGFGFYTGPEFEFYITKLDDNGRPVPQKDRKGYFDHSPASEIANLRDELMEALEEMDITPESSHHECGEGQHEIDIKYDKALKTADNIILTKIAIRELAARKNLSVTFMPKLSKDAYGSGMHTNMSLWENKKVNSFYDENREFGLSKTAEHFIAGLLKHARAITAISNPTINSYKRLMPGYEAPVYITWGRGNRSDLIRVPNTFGDWKKTRIEYRSTDPLCNPYLTFAVQLWAGLDGIEKEMEPPEIFRGNIYELSEKEIEEAGIEILPRSLGEALKEMKNDLVVKEALGKHMFDEYIKAKKNEIDAFNKYVTDWEIDKYFDM